MSFIDAAPLRESDIMSRLNSLLYEWTSPVSSRNLLPVSPSR